MALDGWVCVDAFGTLQSYPKGSGRSKPQTEENIVLQGPETPSPILGIGGGPCVT